MAITEVNGNIFDTNAEIVVIPVNCVGVAGTGLALAAREASPAWFYYYRHACRKKRFTEKTLLTYRPKGFPYTLMAAPTKRHWKNSSDLDMVTRTIKGIEQYCRAHQVKTIALPKLGCGAGGLPYETGVRSLLFAYFVHSDTQVEVWL